MPHPASGYRLKDGTTIPGVTTILNRFKDSGGLMFWAYNQGRSGAPSLYTERDKAADVGTYAHALVEARLAGSPSPAPSSDLNAAQVAQALAAFDAYLSWEKMTKLKIVEREVSLVSETHRYGGTPDAIGLFDNKFCLVDWKTSAGSYVDFLVQMAAYKQLWEENNPDRPLTGGFHLLRLGKDHGDYSHHHYPELSMAWEAFVLMRALYDLDKSLGERMEREGAAALFKELADRFEKVAVRLRANMNKRAA